MDGLVPNIQTTVGANPPPAEGRTSAGDEYSARAGWRPRAAKVELPLHLAILQSLANKQQMAVLVPDQAQGFSSSGLLTLAGVGAAVSASASERN
jgi:hypothetical protein